MKKLILAILLIAPSYLSAQVVFSQEQILDFYGQPAAPTNPPTNYGRFYYDTATSQMKCLNSDGTNCLSSSGSGTVTSVSGTTNQINVATGTTTPVLSISSTLVIPGTITSATYATSGANGGISGIEGTCAGLTAASGSDLLCPNSTAHRWQMSNNNGSFDSVVGLATTDVLVNKTLTTPTIGSFTNATHDHSNAAGGGNISGTAFAPITTTGFMIPAITMYGNIATPTTLVAAQNEMDCVRFIAPVTITSTHFHYSPTVSAGVGSHVGLAIYSSDGTTRLMTTGALDGTLTGAQSVTVSSFTLNAGTAYLACQTDDAATSTTWAAFGITTSNSGYTNIMNGTIKNFVKGATASVAGAPPTSLSTLTAAATFNTPVTFIEP